MKPVIVALLIILLLSSCEKEDYKRPVSLEYTFSFDTESRPRSLAIKNSGNIYVLNYETAIDIYSSKLQVFDGNGEFIKTVTDISDFTQGIYDRYVPVDICTDSKNVWMLVKPYQQYEGNNWYSLNGFCILQFGNNDMFQMEFDFAMPDDRWYPSAIDYSDGFLYIANGLMVKKITMDGESVTDIVVPVPEKDTDFSAFIPVSDMVVRPDGTIWLTGQAFQTFSHDVSVCHLSEFLPGEEQMTTFYSGSETGATASALNNPGIYFSQNGNMYLVTFYGKSVEVFDRNSNPIIQKDIEIINDEETFPIDVVTNDDYIYVADFENACVHVFIQHF